MKTILVPLDAPNLVERLKADLIAMYKPMNTQELFAIERVALAQQALRRCSIMEAGLFAMNFDDGQSETPSEAGSPEAFTFGHPQQLKAWQTFLRYQAQTERMYRRALADLERIIALRDEHPQPEEHLATIPLPVANPSPTPQPVIVPPPPQPRPLVATASPGRHHQ